MPQLKTQHSEITQPLIDFDQWSQLAQSDPAAFEQKRAEVIAAMIGRMPAHKQQRMRCLQWKIDQVRSQAKTPMAACIKLSEMMWDSLVGPGGLKEVLERVGSENFDPPPKAKVLEFQATR